MDYLNLNYLEKTDLDGLINNENNYKKYIAKKIFKNKNITTDGWLLPNKLIKEIIIKKKEVVVKISKKKELLEKDYNVSITLSKLKCINFAKYLGFFSCKDDIYNYNLDKKLPKYFCKNNGTMNYFLFMNYYKYGSIINYIPNTIDEIISILNQVLSSIVLAYEKYGFIHGDLHPGNVLCKSTKRKSIKYSFSNIDKEINTYGIQIIIFDFDSSNFSGDFGMLLNELSTFINLYESYLIEKKLFKNNNIMITPLRTIKREFYKVTNIDNLKKLIGN
jgi:tRNA A-37 threonylcarbamoyl transferase component Bud32